MNQMAPFCRILLILPLLSSLSLFSQSENITKQSQWNGAATDYNDVWGYVDDEEKEYAIIGSKTKVHFLDISNPVNPNLIAEFALGSNTSWRDIKTYGHHAYAVSDVNTDEGLVIFDLCAIGEGVVEKVYQKNTDFKKAHNIFIDPKNAYMYVVGSDTKSGGLIVYDLGIDPENPTKLGAINLPGGYVHDIFVKDNLAFCSHGNSGLQIYDVTNPIAPQAKASINTGAYNHSSWALENDSLLIFAQEVPTGLPLGIINYTEYEDNNIEVIQSFKAPLLAPSHTNNTPHNPYMVGNYAVVSHYEDGVMLFDLSDPFQPERVAYYDTYPSNQSYTGYKGCWGVYPFLPSGNILASDISNGLFVLKPTFDLTSNCNNGKQDWNESSIDCGGVCQQCTPCIREICGNGLDDDRNGKTDCEEEICNCTGYQPTIQIKVLLEGFWNTTTATMTSKLFEKNLLPEYQPFKIAPFFHEGRERGVQLSEAVVDWVLVEARDAEQLDLVLGKTAALLLADGRIRNADGTLGIQFPTITASHIHIVVRHQAHLAVISSEMIDITVENVQYDFTTSATKAMGNEQLKHLGTKYVQHAGDFDQNGIINSLDYNIWAQNNAVINKYLSWDVDGNGIINNQDFNKWSLNRSKVGEPMVHLED